MLISQVGIFRPQLEAISILLKKTPLNCPIVCIRQHM